MVAPNVWLEILFIKMSIGREATTKTNSLIILIIKKAPSPLASRMPMGTPFWFFVLSFFLIGCQLQGLPVKNCKIAENEKKNPRKNKNCVKTKYKCDT